MDYQVQSGILKGIALSQSASKPKVNEEVEEQEQQKSAAPTPKEAVNPNEVLDFLSYVGSSYVPVEKPKDYNVGRYVDSESADGIAQMMEQFEQEVEAQVALIKEDMPELSDSAAYSLALTMVEKNMGNVQQ